MGGGVMLVPINSAHPIHRTNYDRARPYLVVSCNRRTKAATFSKCSIMGADPHYFKSCYALVLAKFIDQITVNLQ